MTWENIKETRFQGLTDVIDFYAWKSEERKLSKIQIKDLKEIRNTISVFGKKAQCWVRLCDSILSKN